MTEYLDISEIENLGEDLEVESPSYSTSGLMEPKNYVSPSRTVRLVGIADGVASFEVLFDAGFQDENGKTFKAGSRYPIKKRISTRKFAEDGRPGETSTVAQYLRACGFNPKGLSPNQLSEAIQESQNVPVQVFVSRTNKAFKTENGDWSDVRLKLSDFNVGTKEEPVYVTEVTKDGVTYRATEKIGGFSRL